MGKLIKAINLFDQNAQSTYLSSNINSGVAVLPWDNPSGFQASWGIQIGKTGQEKSEILVLGTGAIAQGNGTTTSNTLYPHSQDTPIYAIYYDKLIFKRNTAGTTTPATALTDGTVSITPDNQYTTFYDTDGEDSYYYRVAPYNSVLDEEGAESDWLSSTGYSWYSLAKIRERIRNKLHNSNYIKNDEVINDWINEWLETMNNLAVNTNKDYSLASTTVAIGTSGLGTITDTNFKDIRKVEYTTDGTNYYVATQMSITSFDDRTTHDINYPYYYFAGDNILGVKPNIAGTARLHYYKQGTVLVNDSDELPVVMQPYSKSFVDYGVAQASYLDKAPDIGDRYMMSATSEMERFKTQISPRHKSGPKYIDLVSPIDGSYGTHYWG
jgi:hypothetical protein